MADERNKEIVRGPRQYTAEQDFDRANINYTFSDSQTVYVRSDGDDSNDGLTPSEAKETFSSAISDAPVQGDQYDRLTVDIGSDTITPDSTVSFFDTSISAIEVLGETDGSGNPAAVMDFSGLGGVGVNHRSVSVNYKNVEFKGGGGACVYADEQSRVALDNCVVNESTGFGSITTARGGALVVGSDSRVDFDTDNSTGNRVITYQGGYLKILGDITVTGSGSLDNVFNIFDGAGRVDINANVDGGGVTTEMISAQSPVHIKLSDHTYTGFTYLFDMGYGAELVAQDGLSDVTVQNAKAKQMNGGGYTEQGDAPSVGSLPSSNGPPTGVESGTYGPSSPGYYDKSDQFPKQYSDVNKDYIPTTTVQIDGATASDVPNYGSVFDATNSRLLYKDGSGTVHYWNTDGTL